MILIQMIENKHAKIFLIKLMPKSWEIIKKIKKKNKMIKKKNKMIEKIKMRNTILIKKKKAHHIK